ncbi:uncharacterized protein LOC122002125 [Zingiber officinale]|uniref:uncharacterized protein LOC122002125 n=1 Tax=Zingiber officinale TaxID=94328 RepID=UPI001C4A81CC|nr:uncharacterized protein LOC122002125 [Zingiber officinale]
MASQRRIPILSQLKQAVQKVKFLLSFDATSWMLSSLSGNKRSPGRGLSFQVRPSLLDCSGSSSSSFGVVRGTSLSRASSLALSSSETPATAMSRSASDASSSGEDINLKADRFIEGFYRRLQMERQVSLELSYLKSKSLEKTPSLEFN